MKIHKTILLMLYALGFAFALAMATKGFGYYSLPLQERPYSTMHRTFKPGGAWGHGLGMLGSAMILLLFLYSARKRNLFGLRFGKIRYWMNIHILFGIIGPIFVTLHTAFKFGGFVSVSYYAMMAVMLSGFVGRFLYVQIPRALSGDELTMQEIEKRDRHLSRLLVKVYGLDPKSLSQLRQLSGVPTYARLKPGAALLAILKNGFVRPFKIRRLKRMLLRQNGHVPEKKITNLIKIINQKAVLMRKMALLSSIQPIFHHWHVIHKPFAYVMVIIMFLHIGVTVFFGFRWLF